MAIRQPAFIIKNAQLDAVTITKQWHVLQSQSGSTSSLFSTSVSTLSPLHSDALLIDDEALLASTSSADIAFSF